MKIFRDAEGKAFELCSAIKDRRDDYIAVFLHFSKLQEQYRSEYQIKIAVNIMNDLTRSFSGWVCVFSDFNIVLIAPKELKSLIDKMIFQLRYLFMDDPIAYDSDGQDNEAFCTVYDLEYRYKELYNTLKTRMGVVAKKNSLESIKESIQSGTIRRIKSEFTLMHLANIEPLINTLDVQPVLRRQPVCARVSGGGVRSIFYEYYIHIPHLLSHLSADFSVASNGWLFRYMTELLDKRMLEYLIQHAETCFRAPISINLNVSTILSEKFAEFDIITRSKTKASTVIEIHVADVFANSSAYLAAKEYLHKLGYRVCIDGVDHVTIQQLNKKVLGFDLIKFLWNADQAQSLVGTSLESIKASVEACEKNRVILSRCDKQEALAYGQSIGVSLFQGRYLDEIVNPGTTLVN